MNHEVVPAKSKIIKFPILKKELEQHYIRGVFDGDGCWRKSQDNQISFSICGANKLFIETISDILSQSTNLKESKTLNYKNIVYRIGWYGNNNCERIFDYLYKDATIFLDRKYDKSKQLKNNDNRNRNRKVSTRTLSFY